CSVTPAQAPIVIPAKAGTHSSATSNLSCNRTAFPAMTGSYRGKMDPGFRGCHPIGLPRERLRKSGESFDFRGKMPGKDPACGNEWLFPYARGSREKTDTQYRFPERELGDSLFRRGDGSLDDRGVSLTRFRGNDNKSGIPDKVRGLIEHELQLIE